MKEIDELRKEIDLIDREMASLFSKRMDLVKEIGSLKRKNNIKIRDLDREKQVISVNSMYVKDGYQSYYHRLIKTIMDIGKKIQEKDKRVK